MSDDPENRRQPTPLPWNLRLVVPISQETGRIVAGLGDLPAGPSLYRAGANEMSTLPKHGRHARGRLRPALSGRPHRAGAAGALFAQFLRLAGLVVGAAMVCGLTGTAPAIAQQA